VEIAPNRGLVDRDLVVMPLQRLLFVSVSQSVLGKNADAEERSLQGRQILSGLDKMNGLEYSGL
jgi:hypothetical protein